MIIMVSKAKLELAWLAGIVDGEGCLTFYLRTKRLKARTVKYYAPRFRIVSADNRILLEIVRILKERLNIHVAINHFKYPTTAKYPHIYYEIAIYRQHDLKVILSSLVPYLISKKDEGVLLLELLKKHSPRSSYPQQTEAVVEALKILKHNYKMKANPSSAIEKGGL